VRQSHTVQLQITSFFKKPVKLFLHKKTSMDTLDVYDEVNRLSKILDVEKLTEKVWQAEAD